MKRLLLLTLFPLFVHAGNLATLLELAEKNHQVEASHYTLESSQAREDSVKSGYLPSVTLGASHVHNDETNAYSYTKSQTAYAKVSMVLYDGGKREALMDQQEALVQNATYALSATRNTVSLNVIYYYYAYLSALSTQEALKQKMEQLVAERYRLEKFLSVGSATGDEVQKIISSIEQTRVDLITVENTLLNILNTLEYLTKERVTIEAGSTLLFNESSEDEKVRYDILALEKGVQSAKAEAMAAKAPHLPTIAIEDTYSNYEYNKEYTMGLDKQNTIALSVQWKIFDFGSTSSSYEAAYKNYLAKNSELSYEKQKAKASLKNAQNGYKSALLKIEAAKSRLKASEMTYELVKKKFQQGIVNNVTYLDALSDRYSAQAGLQAALNDIEYQKAVILYEMGQEIKGAIQ